MDSVLYFAFVSLLTIVTASGDDESVNLTFKKAALEKNAEGLYITDGAWGSLLKDSDTLEMQRKKLVLKKDLGQGMTKIDDGYSTCLDKYADGTVEIHSDKSALSKYNAEQIDIIHGHARLHRDSDTIIIEDGVLNLTKDSIGSTSLSDKSADISKYSDEYASIIAGKSSIEKESDGNVKMHDGRTAFIEKYLEGPIDIRYAKSYIRKDDGTTEIRGDNAFILNETDGYSEVRDEKLVIIEELSGNLTLDDGRSSIVKDSSSASTIEYGPVTIVKDQTFIQISIRLTTKDLATLMVKIMDHVLYINSNTVSFDVKIPNRIKEENVRMCFSSNGTLNILMHRKNGSISCPQGTTRSESLKEYQK